MLSSLTTTLASLPPDETAFIMAMAPGFFMLLAGFTIRHAMDVTAAKSWRR